MKTNNCSLPVYRLRDLVEDLLAEYDALQQKASSGKAPHPVTGFETLDDELGGGLRPGSHILQAAPGVGKTALALQIAATCGRPAIYVTAETAPTPLFRRVVARHTGTELTVLNGVKVGRDEVRRLAMETVAGARHFRFVDATLRPAQPDLLTRYANALREETGSPALLVIDSVQSWAKGMAEGWRLATEYDTISRGLRELMQIAAACELAVLGVAHRHRAGQERGGLHASKGSGEFEYLAESVLELRRKPDSRLDARGEVQVEVVVLKNRHGPSGSTFRLTFNGATQTFRADGGRRR